MVSTKWLLAAVTLILAGTGVVSGDEPSVPAYDTLSFADRVQCEQRLEKVKWRHRIWPVENPGAKPALEELLPETALRARVADQLDRSMALEVFWSRLLSGEQLQAEVNRIARDSRAPELLRELFTALDNDPLLIAECLARPILVDRLLRNAYARDARFHGTLRVQAEAALLAHRDGTTASGEAVASEWRLATGGSPASGTEESVELDTERWREQIVRLATSFGISVGSGEDLTAEALVEAIPVGRFSGLVEENERYFATIVSGKDADRLRLTTVSWDKRPFEAWWIAEARPTVKRQRHHAVAPPLGGYSMPAKANGGCAEDTWDRLWYHPFERRSHTAVWTGAEMIVWGGNRETSYLGDGGRYDPATDTWRDVPAGSGAPSARAYHTAVWTGTEMIVWGGTAVGTNTGGRYDPFTDTWTPTSTAGGVPTPRLGHTAVWTGSEMIVWGGKNTTVSFNTGGRYDPYSDSWTATSTTAPAPSSREGHTAVWTGTKMIVWGGGAGTGALYDPASGSWTATAVSTSPASIQHEAVWTGTEMIVWGGAEWVPEYDPYGNYLGDILSPVDRGGRYDPIANQWTPTSTSGAPSRRVAHTAVWTGSEMLVWGGSSWISVNSGGRYDPDLDSWTPTSTVGAPPARIEHTGVWTGTELIVWGGNSRLGASGLDLSTGGRYRPASDDWIPAIGEFVPERRGFHAYVWTGTEMIVWGGLINPNQHYLKTGGRYTPATDSWATTSIGEGVPSARSLAEAVWTGTEMIVWGGSPAGSEALPRPGGRYSPVGDTWLPTSIGAGVPPPRRGHTLVWTGSEAIVWGGYYSGFGGTVYWDTGARYSAATDSWTPVSAGPGSPSGRRWHSAIWTGTEMIVWGGTPLVNSGGRYDPALESWTPTSVGANVPEPRNDHTAVWTGTEMIVWGGDDNLNNYFDSGGRFDPASDTWMPTSTVAAPSERRKHRASWTGSSMILWGGAVYGTSTPRQTGGLYDPVLDQWSATSTGEDVPLPRSWHASVWTGTRLIVWGGAQGAFEGELDDGGLYCACGGDTVSIWYPDADDDGVGVSSTSVPSCVPPPGYADVGGDCDDNDSATFPGASEINDGIDNQCPGDLGHGAVDELSGDTTFTGDGWLSWVPQEGATLYQVARSSVPDFSADCVSETTTGTSYDTASNPDPASCWYYLVRAVEPNPGSWGLDSDGGERAVACE